MREGYAAADSEALPPMPKEIAKTIVAVMLEIGKIAKDEYNKYGGYKYASIDSFLDALNPVCAAHGLIIYPAEVHREYERIVDSNNDVKVAVIITFEFILIHAESGITWQHPRDQRGVRLLWSGAQTYGMAQSYALKQFMRGLFMIPTGDPDADEKEQGVRLMERKTGDLNEARRSSGRRATTKTVPFDIGGGKQLFGVDDIANDVVPFIENLPPTQVRAWRLKHDDSIRVLQSLDASTALNLKRTLEARLDQIE